MFLFGGETILKGFHSPNCVKNVSSGCYPFCSDRWFRLIASSGELCRNIFKKLMTWLAGIASQGRNAQNTKSTAEGRLA